VGGTIVVCHIAIGDVAPGCCVRREEGEGYDAAHLDVVVDIVHCCRHLSIVGCHIAIGNVVPAFLVRK